MKASYKIVTYLIIIMSVIHIGFTPIIFDDLSMRTGWFIGVGLMGIFLGFLNITYLRNAGNDRSVKWLCLSANIIALLYGLLVITVDQDPQGFLMAALLAYLTFSSFYISRLYKREPN